MTIDPWTKPGADVRPSKFHLSYDCPEPGYRFIMTTPAANPVLWRDYLDGALANYCLHGVSKALDFDHTKNGHSTSLFFAAVSAAGHVVGGVRVQGPYTHADQAHAIVEWSGHPGQDQVRTMIGDRLRHGVIEIKSAWVADSATQRPALADAIPRAAVHAARHLGARFAFATSAEHTLRRWTSTGAEVVPTLPAVPYPDDRYRTSMIWLDRETFAHRAHSRQLQALLSESAHLAGRARRQAREALAGIGAQ